MLSYAVQVSLGQYRGSVGNGMKNFMVVFKVGFEPDWLGVVWIFFTDGPLGGTKLATLNLTKAFLTGSRPGEASFLIPKIFIPTLYSLVSTSEARLTSSGSWTVYL